MNRLKKELKKHHITGCTDEIDIWRNGGYDYCEFLVCFTKDIIVTKYECNVLDSQFRLYDKNFNLVAVQDCFPETQFFGETGNKWNVGTDFGFPDDYDF